MIRLLAAFLLGCVAAGSAVGLVSVARAIDSSDVNVCFRTDGTNIETSYIDTGATDYYPIASIDEVVTTADGGLVTRHETTFERRERKRVYLAMVSR
jgi:hypothetical protein